MRIDYKQLLVWGLVTCFLNISLIVFFKPPESKVFIDWFELHRDNVPEQYSDWFSVVAAANVFCVLLFSQLAKIRKQVSVWNNSFEIVAISVVGLLCILGDLVLGEALTIVTIPVIMLWGIGIVLLSSRFGQKQFYNIGVLLYAILTFFLAIYVVKLKHISLMSLFLMASFVPFLLAFKSYFKRVVIAIFTIPCDEK